MAKEKEDKVVVEREYTFNFRKAIKKVPRYKKTNKAVKTLKEFVARHMKVEDRDLNKVKLNKYVNEEIWMRGIDHPLTKIKVKVKKLESGIVHVELAEIPEVIKWKIERERKAKETSEKKKPAKVEEKKETKPEEKTEEQKTEIKEKEQATVEAGLKQAEAQAREMKHEPQGKSKTPKIIRKAMGR
jgi:large subunit ribosomal protein L31e